MVRQYVGAALEPPRGYAREHFALEWHGRKHTIEGREPVARDEEEGLLARDDIADLAFIKGPATAGGLVEGREDGAEGGLDL
jgi:hypothetical protein